MALLPITRPHPENTISGHRPHILFLGKLLLEDNDVSTLDLTLVECQLHLHGLNHRWFDFLKMKYWQSPHNCYNPNAQIGALRTAGMKERAGKSKLHTSKSFKDVCAGKPFISFNRPTISPTTVCLWTYSFPRPLKVQKLQ